MMLLSEYSFPKLSRPVDDTYFIVNSSDIVWISLREIVE